MNDVWTIYFHASGDPDWTLGSYVRVADICCVEEFAHISREIETRVRGNMFFLMREGIYPCWDDPCNLYGSSLSLKVPMEEATKAWWSLGALILGETLCDEMACVNGFSVSPKRNFCIFKIWLRDADRVRADFALPDWYEGEVIFKKHVDCIHANSAPPPQRQ